MLDEVWSGSSHSSIYSLSKIRRLKYFCPEKDSFLSVNPQQPISLHVVCLNWKYQLMPHFVILGKHKIVFGKWSSNLVHLIINVARSTHFWLKKQLLNWSDNECCLTISLWSDINPHKSPILTVIFYVCIFAKNLSSLAAAQLIW